ncbi:MAG: signal peptidase I [Candidatus Latescibacterota bacterium]|nr:MAG: signal peptidase I [Candidatus Latescibacterota bacterium]
MDETRESPLETTEAPADIAPRRPGLFRRARTFVKDVVFIVFSVLFLRTFVVQAYQIPSGSMENTLLVGDFLIANKFVYGPAIPFTPFKIKGREPHRGEIVIFRSPTDSKDYIKRVIGLPGEEIEIRENEVLIDGEPMKEQYIALKGVPPHQSNYGPLTIPEGHVFVMGDNRNLSYDSRFWGPLDENLLRGKAEIIHWSWDGTRRRPRLGRIGDLLR